MKYIKKFNEDIDWDFDFEEDEEKNPYLDINGKILKGSISVKYWESDKYTNQGKWDKSYGNYNNKITDVKHSSEITDNAEPKFKFPFSEITDDCYVFSLDGHWPWLLCEERLLDYIK